MTTVSAILLTLSIIIMIVFIVESIRDKNIVVFIIGLLLNIGFFVFPIGIIESYYPNKKDVEKGDAIFVRYDYKNIKNNDTISYTIYEIEWKENK
jgi:hypothetical protein